MLTKTIGHIALAIALGVTHASAQSLPASRVVEIRASDGLILKGTLFPSASPGPAVLLLHQCDEQRKVWNPLGARLAAAGVTVLAIDYRGYGESGGMPHDKLSNADLTRQQNVQWPLDIDSAFAFLQRQKGVDVHRMGAAGGSCGANNATQLARRHPNVKALALLAGGTDRAGRLFLAGAGAPPIFTAAAADDPYANFVQIMGWHAALSQSKESRSAQYKDGGHAAMIFNKHPGLADTIATWLAIELGARKGALPVTNGVPMRADVVRVLNEIDQPGGSERVAKQLPGPGHPQPFPEFFANQLGYEHMLAGEFGLALSIMKLNVAAFPGSPNAMDSLGDVYLAMGNKPAALDAAHKTLDLLKTDGVDTEARKQALRGAAEGKIKQLSAGGRVSVRYASW